MNDLQAIKKRIYEEEKIEYLLDLMGCEHIKPEKSGTLFTASRPNGTNRRSVQVYNDESLSASIRTKGINGDIFTLVSYLINECKAVPDIKNDLPNAKRWLIKQLGYRFTDFQGQQNWNGWLKSIKKQRRVMDTVDSNKPLDECVKRSYVMLPYYGWIQEGISYDTQQEFEVGFDLETKRVVVLIRGATGELLGVKGRALDKEEEQDRKYLYLHSLNKSIELYGLHKTLPYILEKKEVVVFEGFKNVFKAWDYGVRHTVSIEGDNISDAQIVLLKSLGMDVKIVLAFDKDKKVAEVKEQARKIKNRMVYAIYDKEGLLEEKMSPVDNGLKTWSHLYSRKYRMGIDDITGK